MPNSQAEALVTFVRAFRPEGSPDQQRVVAWRLVMSMYGDEDGALTDQGAELHQAAYRALGR